MQHTNKYQFNLIETSDPFSPDPLNQNTQAVEGALEAVDAKADAAQATADRAEGKADTKPYVIGSYTGTQKDQHIELGFRPSAVIVSGLHTVASLHPETYALYFGFTTGSALPNQLIITDTGFTVTAHNGSPSLNELNQKYDYMAFR